MNMTITNRLQVIEGLLVKAEEKKETKFKVNERVAKELIGLPYYWGEYSGVIEQSLTEPRKLITHVKHQVTGNECYWRFDVLSVLDHLKTIQAFSTWEEYYLDQGLRFAEDYENLLIKNNYSLTVREEMMVEYCTKFNVPYKSYLKQ